MDIRRCEYCGKPETNGHLARDATLDLVLCQNCLFVLQSKLQNKIPEPIIVYLACPYFHVPFDKRHARFMQANLAAAWLLARGLGVMSLVSQGYAIASHSNDQSNWEIWKSIGLRMIDACDAMVVCNIDGVDECIGVKAELEHAKIRDLPISWITPIGKNFIASLQKPVPRTNHASSQRTKNMTESISAHQQEHYSSYGRTGPNPQ